MMKEELEKQVHEFAELIYEQGFEDGKSEAMKSVDNGYKHGAHDAWECAKKVVLPSYEGGLAFDVFEEIFGECGYQRVLKKYKVSEAMQKIKEYEQQKQEEIKVGDEVRIKGSDPIKDDCDYGICTRSLPKINTIYVMRRDGSSGEENKDEWYKTGRHFPQIAEVLKQLRGEE